MYLFVKGIVVFKDLNSILMKYKDKSPHSERRDVLGSATLGRRFWGGDTDRDLERDLERVRFPVDESASPFVLSFLDSSISVSENQKVDPLSSYARHSIYQ